MPLMKYFGFVGSVLVLLLIGIGWCFPQPAEPLSGGNDRPAIRIASAEQLPERIVIDTSLPTIVPPPSVLEFAERWPQEPATSVEHLSKPVPPAPVSGLLKTQNPAKQEPPKKIAAHRAAPKPSLESAKSDKVPASPAVTRLSLLDLLKDGVEQTQAKLLASLEPLTTHISKLRPETR
ncbi:hypothetical protein ABIF66_001800 [Bradyrhizobium japonicum]